MLTATDKFRRVDPLTVKNTLVTIHLAAAFALFAALGAICLGSSKKAGHILHGASLTVILLAGFAILRKPPMDQYWWMVKILLWIVIGAAPAMTNRMPKWLVLLITIAAAAGAAYLGLTQRF